MDELSIYLHIPFCVRKCLYCDFLSFPVCGDGNASENRRTGISYVNLISPEKAAWMKSYVNLIRDEIVRTAPEYKKYRVISVFVGGGTPSLLPTGAMSAILDAVRSGYRLEEDAEITVEMNPDTVTEEKLREYITCGIDRLSIGLQSADDAELARIGRIHDYGTFARAYETARRVGFANINIDLMAALPGQTAAAYERTLRRVAALAPEHISAYSLTLEENTPLYERRQEFSFPSEEEEREMYALTGTYLASCGYHRYEISNYARDGFECRHNKVYWRRGNYVGFGLGASSMTENVRWKNPAEGERYRDYVGALAGAAEAGGSAGLRAKNAEEFALQRLSVPEQMEEFMFLGLRMMRGVSGRTFRQVFGAGMEETYGAVIGKLCGQGLLERDGERVRLTERGIDLSNYVMAQFLFG